MATPPQTTNVDSQMFKFLQHRDNTFVYPEGKESLDYWDMISKNYDNTYKGGISFKHVIIGAREFNKSLRDLSKDACIADVGAGTGLVGEELKREYGFTNITAFDLSSCMLEEAKKKCAYSQFVMCDLNKEDMTPFYGQFDHAISIASFVSGIIKPLALEKVARFVKPGGFVCISFRENNFDDEETKYKQTLEELEKKGIWREVSRVLDEYVCLDPDNVIKAYYITLQIC